MYDSFATQEQIWNDLGNELVDSALTGYNYSLFAYGQTGSGKTYSMLGFGHDKESKGILPRACEAIFKKIGSSLKKSNRDGAISYKVEVRQNLYFYNTQNFLQRENSV